MESRILRALFHFTAALALVSLSVVGLAAQDDPDPNSPTPILLSYADSNRALAQPVEMYGRVAPTATKAQAFLPDSTVVIFATNLTPMPGEGANAYRVYSIDKTGHLFRFPVLDVKEIPNSKRVFAITLQLTDEIRFWSPPAADGDMVIYLAWRGLASNTVKLGLGQMGGSVKETPARATPWEGQPPVSPSKGARKDSHLGLSDIGYKWTGDRMRFLEQATFGPTAALDNRLRRIGLNAWLAEQFEAQYPSISNPYPNQPLKPSNAPADCDNDQTVTPDVPVTCFRDTYSMYQPQTWFFREALYGEAPLRHRVSWALNQIWVTAAPEVQQSRYMMEYQKIIGGNAFGNYRDLIKQMTLNPAMGQYLDMAISTRTNPNENYAREVMQLFSIGLFMLNQDGTLQRDQNGDPIPTYTQDGVNNLTRVLTGWSFCNQPASCPNIAVGTVNFIDPMLLNPGVTTGAANRHDIGAKTLLTYPGSAATDTIAACPTTGANRCGLTCGATGNCALVTGTTNAQAIAGVQTYANASFEQSIDNLFNHPNVGPFVGKIMIQHMVTSDPTPAYVGRVAAAFNNNGFGVRGDMKAVVRAILLDPEARGDVKTDPNYGKLREPVQYATNILRAFNVRGANGSGQTDGYMTGRGEFTGMAQVPFQSPTVFNFFPPDYGIPGTTLLGPEFAIMTTSTAIQRTNFVNRFVFTAIPIAAAPPNSPTGLSLDFADLQALSAADNTGGLLVDELSRRMLHSTMSPSMKSIIQTAVTTYAATDTLNRVRQAIYLVATSSQFQVQR